MPRSTACERVITWPWRASSRGNCGGGSAGIPPGCGHGDALARANADLWITRPNCPTPVDSRLRSFLARGILPGPARRPLTPASPSRQPAPPARPPRPSARLVRPPASSVRPPRPSARLARPPASSVRPPRPPARLVRPPGGMSRYAGEIVGHKRGRLAETGKTDGDKLLYSAYKDTLQDHCGSKTALFGRK
jgi:hypothetical protein